MQIFPINPTNNSIVSSSQRRNKNISFQSAETALILMVAREGVNIVKNYRKQEVIRALSRGLSDMQYCGEDFARSVYSGIAKLQDSFSIDVSDVFSSLKPRSRENILAEQRFNNLFLIYSLDKTYYKDFVEENRTTINQTKQFVKQFLQRNCSSDEFGLFQFYNEKLSNL